MGIPMYARGSRQSPRSRLAPTGRRGARGAGPREGPGSRRMRRSGRLGDMASDRIESRLKEERRFHPGAAFANHARVTSHHAYAAMHRQSLEEPEVFWREQTADLVWRTPWKTFADWELPRARFFIGAKLNLTESCLERHLKTAHRTKAALVWEGSPATRARSPTSSCTGRSCGLPRRCRISAWGRVTASPSTWAWCPRR